MKSECEKHGSKEDSVLPIVGDIGDEKFRESLIAATVDKYKQIDVLVNNAGEYVRGSPLPSELRR